MFERNSFKNKLPMSLAIGASALMLSGCGDTDPNSVGDCPVNYETTLTVNDSGAVAKAFSKAETQLDGELKTVTNAGDKAKLQIAYNQLFNGYSLRYIDSLGKLVCNYTPTELDNPVLVLTPFAEQALGKLEAAGITVDLKNSTLNVPDLNG